MIATDPVAPATLPAWSAFADAAAVASADRLLDLGCGAGELCALAATRGASVHGVDAAPSAIERARLAVPEGDFRIALIEDLPWPDETFDVVTAFNSLQYALDVDAALEEARRVARRDGRVAICKWARPQENEFFAFLIAVGAVPARALRARDPVDDALRRSRLSCVRAGEIPLAMEMADAPTLETALISAGALDARAEDQERHRLLTAAERFRQADGSYRFVSRLGYVIAVR